MTNFDFLAGLPAILGVGGYVAYYIGRLREKASPILKSIIEIIKQKGSSLPELDERLTAKQVFMLIEKNSDLRKKLEKKDYELLESIMRRDERSHLFALTGLLISLFMSFCAYAYIQTTKPKISSVTIISKSSGVANTIDNLDLIWSHSGQNGPYSVRITNANTSGANVTKQVMAADHKLQLDASELSVFWPHPQLSQRTQLRVEFFNDSGSSNFGPFEVVSALEIMYFLENKQIEVYSMDGQNRLMPHTFEVRCIVWPKKAKNGMVEPESVSLTTSNGKAKGSFIKTDDPDKASSKCIYLGTYPSNLVRYTNLNIQ